MSEGRWAMVLAVLTLATLTALIPGRVPPDRIWGDEGTFLAMAESLVKDGDLHFDAHDRDRLESYAVGEERGRATVILQRQGNHLAYSKPVLYPILSAPFVAVLGDRGPWLLNALCLLAALALAFAYLRRVVGSGRSALLVVTFAGASVLLPYVLWRMTDLVQTALVLAGLVLTLGPERWRAAGVTARDRVDRLLLAPFAPWIGGAFLGLATSMRLSNAVLAGIPLLAAVLARRPMRALAPTVAALGAWLALVGVTLALTGVPVSYRAARTSFTPETGYPAEAADAVMEERLVERPARHVTSWKPRAGLDRPIAAFVTFWVGRHTGLLIYFPVTLVLLLAALRRPDAATIACLAGFAGAALFYVGWMPWNYFGGHTFIGNRYVLPALPALLLAPKRLPGPRLLAVAWVVAALGWASAAVSSARVDDGRFGSQRHTYAGLFRLLPYETVAIDLVARDRYWDDLFVRFVDPYSDPGRWSFGVRTDVVAAEVMVAGWQEVEALRLLVETEAPDTTLVVRDHGRESTFALDGRGRTTVDFVPSRAWRRHRFWWHPEQRYWVRTLRFALRSASGDPARARIFLIGDPAAREEAFSYHLLEAGVTTPLVAGTTAEVRLRVRNTSPRVWRAQGVTPVVVRQRLRPHAAVAGEPVPTAVSHRLERDIAPGEVLDLELPVDVPFAPGRHRLDVDLILVRVGAFRSRLDAPVYREDLDVVTTPVASTETE